MVPVAAFSGCLAAPFDHGLLQVVARNLKLKSPAKVAAMSHAELKATAQMVRAVEMCDIEDILKENCSPLVLPAIPIAPDGTILHVAAYARLAAPTLACMDPLHSQVTSVQVVWTPPYHSEYQPIEQLWSWVKGQVAREFVISDVHPSARSPHTAFHCGTAPCCLSSQHAMSSVAHNGARSPHAVAVLPAHREELPDGSLHGVRVPSATWSACMLLLHRHWGLNACAESGSPSRCGGASTTTSCASPTASRPTGRWRRS